MNLIQQLQATPKWKEFEEWYDKQIYHLPLLGLGEGGEELGFSDLSFPFNKGVFEKFIESQDVILNINDGYITGKDVYHVANSFEELLIWYFNN